MGARKIFLCYRRADSPGYVSRLENDLELAFGPDRVFRDVEDIKGGSKWQKVLENNLSDAAAVLLVIGPRWGAIWQARRDDKRTNYIALELGLARERGIPVIPVTVDGATFPSNIDLGEIAWIQENQFYDISDKQGRWSSDLNGLVSVLETIEGVGGRQRVGSEEKPAEKALRETPRLPATNAGDTRSNIRGYAIGLVILLALALAAWLGLRDSSEPVANADSEVHEDTRESLAKSPASKGSLSLTAILAKGKSPIDGLQWAVYDIPVDELVKPTRITYGTDTKQVFELPSGRYRIRVQRGAASVDAVVDVRAGKLSKSQLNLNAGYTNLTAVLHEPGDVVEGVFWEVFDIPAEQLTKPSRVIYGYDANQTFVLSEGRYRVRVTKGVASAETELNIVAGEPREARLTLNAGYTQLTTVLRQGGEPVDGVFWQVFDIPADALGKPSRITYGYDTEQLFLLAAGRYRVRVTKGAASVETTLSVDAGKLSATELDLNAGYAQLTAVLRSGGDPVGNVNWQVFDIPTDPLAKPKRITYGSATEQIFVLSANRYRVQVVREQMKAEQIIDVRAGQLTSSRLTLE